MFVGDLDPADILVFEWLRLKLAPIEVLHYGINDVFLALLNVTIPKAYQIPLKESETAAVAELPELVPDIEVVLSTNCFQLLKRGYKIELEAVVTAVGNASWMPLNYVD
jgi:hypothetical protein